MRNSPKRKKLSATLKRCGRRHSQMNKTEVSQRWNVVERLPDCKKNMMRMQNILKICRNRYLNGKEVLSFYLMHKHKKRRLVYSRN
jgi:hypothetical protein